MNVEEFLSHLEPQAMTAEGLQGEFFLSDESDPICTECQRSIEHGAEHHRWTFVRGQRVHMFHVQCFCSSTCRDLWWRSGADVDLFEVDTLADREKKDPHRAAFFFDSVPGHTYDVNFVCTIVDQNPGQALQEALWLLPSGQLAHLPMQESARAKFKDLPPEASLHAIRLIPSQLRGQILFGTPDEFHKWWRAPVDVDEDEKSVAAWKALEAGQTIPLVDEGAALAELAKDPAAKLKTGSKVAAGLALAISALVSAQASAELETARVPIRIGYERHALGTPGTGDTTGLAPYFITPDVLQTRGEICVVGGWGQTHAAAGMVGAQLCSMNGGRTWGQEERDIQILLDPDHDVPSVNNRRRAVIDGVTTLPSVGKPWDGRIVWSGFVQQPSFSGSYVVDVFSSDGGFSSGAPITVADIGTYATIAGGPPLECEATDPCPLGRLVQPVYWQDLALPGHPFEHRKTAGVVYSDDGGVTWEQFADGIVARDPSPSGIQYTEHHLFKYPAIAEAGPIAGCWGAIIRGDDNDQKIYESDSCDGGETWSGPRYLFPGSNFPTVLMAPPCGAGRPTWTIYVLTRHATPGIVTIVPQAYGVWRKSTDFGQSWSDEHDLSDPAFGGPEGTLGGAMTLLDNCRIGVVHAQADPANPYGHDLLEWIVLDPDTPEPSAVFSGPELEPNPLRYLRGAVIGWWPTEALFHVDTFNQPPIYLWPNSVRPLEPLLWGGSGTQLKASQSCDQTAGMLGGLCATNHAGSGQIEVTFSATIAQPVAVTFPMDAIVFAGDHWILDNKHGLNLRWTGSSFFMQSCDHWNDSTQVCTSGLHRMDFAGGWPATNSPSSRSHIMTAIFDGAASQIRLDGVSQSSTGAIGTDPIRAMRWNGHNAGFINSMRSPAAFSTRDTSPSSPLARYESALYCRHIWDGRTLDPRCP